MTGMEKEHVIKGKGKKEYKERKKKYKLLGGGGSFPIC
jgi:hypothetical protein